jgi:CrcB protein
MKFAIIVFLGAGLGGAMRYGVNHLVTRLTGASFPLGILTVNVLGCFAMGVIVGWFALRSDPGPAWRLFLTTGVLGGFTTFSAFALDSAMLWERGTHGSALGYVLLSVIGSLFAVFIGLALARSLS